MRTPLALAAAAAALGGAAVATAAYTYDVSILERYDEPAMSIKKPTGKGYSPCTYTFNPAWLEPVPGVPGLNRSILLFRAAGCPPTYGGSGDHLLFAYCEADGTCGDAQSLQFPFEAEAEDPRVVFWDGWWYLYYYASGSGQATVYLRKSQTPLDPSSWVPVLSKPLAWHRNGCVLLRPNGTHYVIFGESGGPKVRVGGGGSRGAGAEQREAWCSPVPTQVLLPLTATEPSHPPRVSLLLRTRAYTHAGGPPARHRHRVDDQLCGLHGAQLHVDGAVRRQRHGVRDRAGGGHAAGAAVHGRLLPHLRRG
jgi:hypothetical protein